LARKPPSTELTPRRVVVTGGAGFVGHAVVRKLRERGDHVVALVRDAGRAQHLADLGAELVVDDLSDIGGLTERLRGADALIHAAGSYRIGIRKSERGTMWDANVGTTTRVLDAAEAAGTSRIVYVSTANVFGNTHGQVVDESYRRDLRQGFLSWYDETKYGAHEVAEQRIAAGAPIVIVLPSQVYGPGDHSGIGEQMRLAFEGRLRYRAVDDVGVGLVHVDDLAAGIVAALDRGVAGQAYVLSGPRTTLGQAIALAAELGGHRPPVLHIPTGLLRVMAPFGGLIGQPNLAEVISASAGVTYLASSDRAVAELGFAPRPIEDGLRDTFAPG
jgi:dihydroflavonol-4-reductase